MRKLVFITASLTIAGCAAPPRMTWLRTDGQYVVASPALSTQFTIDQTSCYGEAEKAKLSAGTNYYGGIIAHAVEEGRRNQASGQVLEGCMAGKGYVRVTEAEAAATSATLAATQKERQKLAAPALAARR